MLLSLGQGRFRGKKMTRFAVYGICGMRKPWRLFCCAGKSVGLKLQEISDKIAMFRTKYSTPVFLSTLLEVFVQIYFFMNE